MSGTCYNAEGGGGDSSTPANTDPPPMETEQVQLHLDFIFCATARNF